MTAASDPALSLADTLAARFVASAEPLQFRAAQTQQERDAAFRLRFLTIVEEGWAKPSDFPGGLARDSYDDAAAQITGWDGPVLAATARLVFPCPGQRLPTENDFGVDVEPRGQVVDVGRGIVAPAYRGRRHRVFLALLARCWLETRKRGFHRVCGAANDSLLGMYQEIGFRFHVLGPARLHYGEQRRPIALDVAASLVGVTQKL